MKKITLNVKGMHCSSCEMLIQEGLGELAGVEAVLFSNVKGTVIVEYDDSKLNEADIKTTIVNEGYEVEQK